MAFDWRAADRRLLERKQRTLLGKLEATRAAESRARVALAQVESELLATQADLRRLDVRATKQAARAAG